jgi:hypothetical protein
MKKLIGITVVCAALLGAFALESCAKPPTDEMNRATEAVSRAENDADAVLYAGNTLARARDSLKRMQAEANSKRYDAAKTYAAEAVTAADKAIADGRAAASRAKDEAAALVAELRPAIAETARSIDAAESAKLPLDFGAIGKELDSARFSTDVAQNALAANNYQDALSNGRTARAGISDINQKLSDAALAVSRKK